MALIPCPECGKMVSEHAPACPECGTPLAAKPQPTQPVQPQPVQPQPAQPTTAKPDSGLIWGILTTLFCCLPLGIVSIVYAAKVDSAWAAGRYQEAIESAHNAKKWATIGAVSALVISVLYILFWVVIAGVAAGL